MSFKWADGLDKWDLWSFCAIVCEADMPKDSYIGARGETDAVFKIKKHIDRTSTSSWLKQLMKDTCLKGKESDFPYMDEIMNMVVRIKFTQYETDLKPEVKVDTDTEPEDNIISTTKAVREVLVE